MKGSPPKISGTAQGNIESITQIEQEFVRQRSRVDLKEMVEKTTIAHLAQELAQNLEHPRDTNEPPRGG